MYKNGRVKGGKCVVVSVEGVEIGLLDAAKKYSQNHK
jgi:hypothetical protein